MQAGGARRGAGRQPAWTRRQAGGRTRGPQARPTGAPKTALLPWGARGDAGRRRRGPPCPAWPESGARGHEFVRALRAALARWARPCGARSPRCPLRRRAAFATPGAASPPEGRPGCAAADEARLARGPAPAMHARPLLTSATSLTEALGGMIVSAPIGTMRPTRSGRRPSGSWRSAVLGGNGSPGDRAVLALTGLAAGHADEVDGRHPPVGRVRGGVAAVGGEFAEFA